MSVIVEQIKDESRRKELRSHDEEEDYLDEGFAFTYYANVCVFLRFYHSLVSFGLVSVRM